MASGETPKASGGASFGESSPKKVTVALISGKTLSSRSSKRTLTGIVAFVRSAVGTIRLTLPR